MLWVIRWTDTNDGNDKAIVVEARSPAEAEYMGLKRGIPIVFLGEASDRDVAEARRAGLLWKHSTPTARYTCFGQPVKPLQMAALLLLGVTTISLHLTPVVATVAAPILASIV